MKLEPYEKYKESGVEWLKKIPKHWVIGRVKQIGEVNGRVGWKALKASEYVDEGYFFLSTPNIKNKDIDFKNVNYITKERYDESPEIILKVDDILLTKDGSTLGTVNIVKYLPSEGTVNSSIAVLRFNNDYENNYVFYQILSNYIQNVVKLKKDGAGVPHLFQRDINLFNILTPPISEQTSIATYLDHQTTLIDQKIDLLSQKIEKYQELKKSLINETVCRGLDPTVPMKDSGVEWIGEVPRHWEVKRVKDIFRLERGKFTHRPRNDARMYENGKYPFIQTGDVSRSGKYVRSYKQVLNEEGIKVSREFKAGTLVMTIAANIGDVAILSFDSYFPDSIMSFHTNHNIDYLYYLLETTKQELDTVKVTNTQDNLNLERLNGLLKILPPFSEQYQIASYLDEKIAKIELITSNLSQQINTLKELRKTLINDVVTGKLKAPPTA
ncbi:MAG: restriction endonuclease subunit S [Bacteroidota bacterium]